MKKYFGLLLMILVLPMLAGCLGDETPEEPVVTEEPVVATEEPLNYYVVENIDQIISEAKDRYDQAEELAQNWQTDAELLLVSTKYFSSLSDDGIVDRFLFSSDIKPDLYMAVDVSKTDSTKYTRNLIFREDYVLKSGVLPIPLQYWKLSGAEAIELADSLGGAQYRENNVNFQVTEVLSLAGGNNLAWYVVYSNSDNNDVFEIVVDANAGSLIG